MAVSRLIFVNRRHTKPGLQAGSPTLFSLHLLGEHERRDTSYTGCDVLQIEWLGPREFLGGADFQTLIQSLLLSIYFR